MKYFVGHTRLLFLLICLLIPLLSIAQLSPGDLSEAHAHLEGISNCTLCHVLNQNVSNEKCLACHESLNDRIEQNKGYHASSDINGKECTSCHSDHHGRKFQMIRFDTTNFNHQLTGYLLEGSHSKTSCSKCHNKTFITNEKIRNLNQSYLGLKTDCLNCHDDFHDNTLSNNCISCHDFETFKKTPNFNHNNSAFKLIGKHMEVSCEKCHPLVIRNNEDFRVFKGLEFGRCTNCHTDVHDNKFGQDCKKCHTEQSFHAVIGINNFDHNQTNFKLEGKHMFVKCEKCHPVNYTAPKAHNVCMDCHDDYHESQFTRNGNMPDCAICHTVEGFKPSSYTLEQHQASIFPLEGAHLATPCFNCHRKEDKWQFREIGLRCAECHEDIHKTTLPEKYYPEQACKSCHSMESWKQIGFDHALTKYELTGAHEQPNCRECHQNTNKNDNNTIQFSGVSTACASCHQDQHAGQFIENGKIDCARCHENVKWKPVNLDHNKTRFALDGKHNQLSCVACHKPTTINEVITIQYKFEDIRCESCH